MLKNLDAAALGPKRLVQMLLGIAAFVLIAGVAVVFLLNSHIHDMQATVSGKETQVGSNEQVAQRYEKTQADYDKVAAQTQYLEASVSAKAFVPTLLKQLQALATTTHLTVMSVRPGLITTPAPPADSTSGTAADSTKKKTPPPPYDTIDIGVDVSGSYADTATFLYNLTKFPKIISVASVQMAPGSGVPVKGAQTGPTLTTNLHLTAFVFHDDGTAPIDSTQTVVADAVAPAALPTTTAGSHTPAPAAASPFPPRPASPSRDVVTDAATHAASRAIGAGKAAQTRSEVGIQTL